MMYLQLGNYFGETTVWKITYMTHDVVKSLSLDSLVYRNTPFYVAVNT